MTLTELLLSAVQTCDRFKRAEHVDGVSMADASFLTVIRRTALRMTWTHMSSWRLASSAPHASLLTDLSDLAQGKYLLDRSNFPALADASALLRASM